MGFGQFDTTQTRSCLKLFQKAGKLNWPLLSPQKKMVYQPVFPMIENGAVKFLNRVYIRVQALNKRETSM